MTGILTRAISAAGCIALAVIAYQMATGAVRVEDAALRAGVTFLAVVVVLKLGRAGLAVLADAIDPGVEPQPVTPDIDAGIADQDARTAGP